MKDYRVIIDTNVLVTALHYFFRMMPDLYLEERAKRATDEGFVLVLSQVPDVPPADYDKLPPVQ